MTDTDILAALEAAIARAGGVTALAREWGTSKEYVCMLRRGYCRFGPRVHRRLGLEPPERPRRPPPSEEVLAARRARDAARRRAGRERAGRRRGRPPEGERPSYSGACRAAGSKAGPAKRRAAIERRMMGEWAYDWPEVTREHLARERRIRAWAGELAAAISCGS